MTRRDHFTWHRELTALLWRVALAPRYGAPPGSRYEQRIGEDGRARGYMHIDHGKPVGV